MSRYLCCQLHNHSLPSLPAYSAPHLVVGAVDSCVALGISQRLQYPTIGEGGHSVIHLSCSGPPLTHLLLGIMMVFYCAL